MRIVVYGTGGAGGYFGAQLALSGEQVIFIARGEHLKALRSNGLRLETPNGDTVIRPVEATDDPASVTGADVVLVGVKAWQVPDAAQALRPLVGRGTFVVPLQNGVEAASQLSAVLGADHVLGGLCGTLSWVAGPGHIRVLSAGVRISSSSVNSMTAAANALNDCATRLPGPQSLSKCLPASSKRCGTNS